MIFVPKNRHRIFSIVFPSFKIVNNDLQLYLGHIITNSLSNDDDIQREMRSMFVRCNLLIRKFSNRSKAVKLKIFSRSVCVFMILLCGHHSTRVTYINLNVVVIYV